MCFGVPGPSDGDVGVGEPARTILVTVKVAEPGMQCSSILPPDVRSSPLQLLPCLATISFVLAPALPRSEKGGYAGKGEGLRGVHFREGHIVAGKWSSSIALSVKLKDDVGTSAGGTPAGLRPAHHGGCSGWLMAVE